MVNTPHALERHPVLEPQYPVLRAGTEAVFEKPLDEVGHRLSALGRHVTHRIVSRDQGTRPHDQVGDAGGESIGPVVDKNRVIRLVSKGRGGGRREGRLAPGLGKTAGKQEVGGIAVLGRDVGAPLDVPPKIGRLPREEGELVGLWKRVSVGVCETELRQGCYQGNWAQNSRIIWRRSSQV